MTDEFARLKSTLADRYSIEREIGSGGMAVVYLAEDLKHKRKVALKVLRAELAAAIGSERFVREIEIAAKLSHPHILPLYDSGEADGILYYVMPYVEGESLRERLDREGKIPIPEMVRLTDEIASALSYAHEHGIVHRDVKPENIMLSGGRAVVTDFGIARAVTVAGGERLTGTGFAVGTPAYMSPEQAFGDSNVDGRSDVYALGCVAYEMVAGRAPFEAGTPQALLAKHAADTVPSIRASDSAIPLYVERAVERSLAKDANDRFHSATEFAEALTSEMVVARVGKRVWSKPVIAGAATAAVLIAALSFSLLLGGPEYERLAVLPPTNLLNEPEQEHLIQGVHEALIGELQKAGITVKARTSVMRYQSGETPIREIAGELGVDALIEPSVRWGTDSVEIDVRLVAGETEEYVGDPIVAQSAVRNVIGTYRELVRQVAGELELVLSPEAEARLARADPVNPAAYEDYLNGRFHWGSLTPAGLRTSLGYYEAALEKEPEFARAHAGIAHVWAARQQMGITPPSVAGPKAREALARALAIDSTGFEVQYVAGAIRTWVNWDWEGGEASFRRAIDINPAYAEVRAHYAHLLMILGRLDEAEAQMGRAMELDSLNPLVLAFYGQVLIGGRHVDEAISFFEKVLNASPENPVALWGRVKTYEMRGRTREALERLGPVLAMYGEPEPSQQLQETYSEEGAAAAWSFAANVAADLAYIPRMVVALLYDYAGNSEEAISWIQRAVDVRDPNAPYLTIEPYSEAVMNDPHIAELLLYMNLPT